VRAAVPVLGYSERQRQRWWATDMVGGLAALLTRSPRLNRQERVSADAWHAVEVEMRAGRITGLEDAQRYLRAHWGSDDRSLNGVSQLF
jgi:hypothetical protein